MIKRYLWTSWEWDFLLKVSPTKFVHKSNICESPLTKNSKISVFQSSFTGAKLVAHSSFTEGSYTTKNTASEAIFLVGHDPRSQLVHSSWLQVNDHFDGIFSCEGTPGRSFTEKNELWTSIVKLDIYARQFSKHHRYL